MVNVFDKIINDGVKQHKHIKKQIPTVSMDKTISDKISSLPLFLTNKGKNKMVTKAGDCQANKLTIAVIIMITSVYES